MVKNECIRVAAATFEMPKLGEQYRVRFADGVEMDARGTVDYRGHSAFRTSEPSSSFITHWWKNKQPASEQGAETTTNGKE